MFSICVQPNPFRQDESCTKHSFNRKVPMTKLNAGKGVGPPVALQAAVKFRGSPGMFITMKILDA